MYEVFNQNDFSIIKIKRNDIEVELLNYGASIYNIRTKDKQGVLEDIVLKYKNLEDYLNNNIYLNATIGPIAGRVKNAIIKTDKELYHLDKNSDNLHTLHSGSAAVSYQFFDYEITEYDNFTEVLFYLEMSKPVNYRLRVFYKVYDSKIRIDYEIETEEDFVFNLTNHAYFNLSGNLSKNIRSHEVILNSNLRHELDQDLVFTGKIINEKGIYDFRVNSNLDKTIEQLEKTSKGGVDDIYYFPKNDLRKVMAEVFEPASKRIMKVKSTMDHLVFYTHNNINKLPLEHLDNHFKHYALCFECQKAPYGFQDGFAKKTLIKAGKIGFETIIFEFSIKK